MWGTKRWPTPSICRCSSRFSSIPSGLPAQRLKLLLQIFEATLEGVAMAWGGGRFYLAQNPSALQEETFTLAVGFRLVRGCLHALGCRAAFFRVLLLLFDRFTLKTSSHFTPNRSARRSRRSGSSHAAFPNPPVHDYTGSEEDGSLDACTGGCCVRPPAL